MTPRTSSSTGMFPVGRRPKSTAISHLSSTLVPYTASRTTSIVDRFNTSHRHSISSSRRSSSRILILPMTTRTSSLSAISPKLPICSSKFRKFFISNTSICVHWRSRSSFCGSSRRVLGILALSSKFGISPSSTTRLLVDSTSSEWDRPDWSKM